MMTSAEIRKKFLDFFVSKGHVIVPSAPIVIKNDPTLLFTNAGMNQFKDYFLGNSKAPYPRVADTQKCLRVSGKHNDLEEVGVDTYHHTMFEMLGNWSFGDPADPSAGYFKKEAIAWSWELLTDVFDIPKDRLYVTVFEGDKQTNLGPDTEAHDEWKKWIEPGRILMGSKKDNFWEMGDTGPCGPCTEVHVDCRTDDERKQQDGAALVNKDHPQVIEIWNNVFMQFNRLKDGSLQQLPAKHVDTGMGLERLVRVLQGKSSNYDTDLFQPLIQFLERDFKKTYGKNEKIDIAMRVISDHIRAVSFAIADDQLPSNTGAGYVIRRILRRAIRYGYSYLDAKKPFMYELVDSLDLIMEDTFPELKLQKEFIKKVIKEEEVGFFKTLSDGMWKIQYFIQYGFHDSFPISKAESYAAHAKKLIPGKLAFNMYDTDGFPLDLTKLVAAENDFTVDAPGFAIEMQGQKQRSRTASAQDVEDWTVLIENPLIEFVGYDSLETNTKVVKYRKATVKGKESWQLVLEATPFYAESGGQVGDRGTLYFGPTNVEVVDTKKENNLIVHFVNKFPSFIGMEVIAIVDRKRRKAIESHHSATHLLHAALRQVLGKHVAQKGSLVNEEYLRFDFSSAAVTEDQLKEVESIVNEKIRENIPVSIQTMNKAQALNLGAMALFGEKYGETVRVVTIDPNFSIELCGGTHVDRTGDIGFLVIIQETAVGAGVRRIEAKAAKAAFEYLYDDLIYPLESVKRLTKKKSKEMPAAIENLINEVGDLRKKLEKSENKQLAETAQFLRNRVQHLGGTDFVGEIVEVSSAEALKKLCFDLKADFSGLSSNSPFVVVLAANVEGKAAVAVLLDERLVETRNLQAPAIIKEHIAPLIKGGGGGQKTLATAGGQDASNLPLVIERVKKLLESI
jgi:alanyl-tRNA synthetase